MVLSRDILRTMDSQWLKTQFELNPDKSKADLARHLNLEPPAISKILKNMRQIKAQEYIQMRAFFGLPSDGDKAVFHKNAYTISPLPPENAQLQDHENNDSDWVIPADILNKRTKAAPEDIKIFQVQENMMEPDFLYGDSVLVDLSDCALSPPGTFIVSDGFGHMIRHCEFLPKSNPPEVRISARKNGFNPQVLALRDFKIIGRVIAKLQMI